MKSNNSLPLRHMRSTRGLQVRISLVALFCVSIPLGAQTTAGGSIRGHISDASGSVVPGVAVSAQSPNVGALSPGLPTMKETTYSLTCRQPQITLSRLPSQASAN
jgi:hypothetical protein